MPTLESGGWQQEPSIRKHRENLDLAARLFNPALDHYWLKCPEEPVLRAIRQKASEGIHRREKVTANVNDASVGLHTDVMNRVRQIDGGGLEVGIAQA